jgi:hypothetical protein
MVLVVGKRRLVHVAFLFNLFHSIAWFDRWRQHSYSQMTIHYHQTSKGLTMAKGHSKKYQSQILSFLGAK